MAFWAANCQMPNRPLRCARARTVCSVFPPGARGRTRGAGVASPSSSPATMASSSRASMPSTTPRGRSSIRATTWNLCFEDIPSRSVAEEQVFAEVAEGGGSGIMTDSKPKRRATLQFKAPHTSRVRLEVWVHQHPQREVEWGNLSRDSWRFRNRRSRASFF